tara:strand:- start:1055 stop:1462 length:408 start_codon:yes stop_codon:yes gene_type:complete
MKAIDLANFLSKDNLESLKQDDLLDVAMNDFLQTLLEQEDYCKTVAPEMKDNQLISTFYGITDINSYVEHHMRMGNVSYERIRKAHDAIELQMLESAKNLDIQLHHAKGYLDTSYSLAYHYIDQDISLDDDTFIE